MTKMDMLRKRLLRVERMMKIH